MFQEKGKNICQKRPGKAHVKKTANRYLLTVTALAIFNCLVYGNQRNRRKVSETKIQFPKKIAHFTFQVIKNWSEPFFERRALKFKSLGASIKLREKLELRPK